MRNHIFLAGICCLGGLLVTAPSAQADMTAADVYKVTAEGQGKKIGTVMFSDGINTLEIWADLSDLPPGEHGFHIHEKGTCAPAEKDGAMVPAQAAGGHYDPSTTGTHKGPEGGGHKGDLPALTVTNEGTVHAAMKVDDLQVKDIKGRSIMIHAGGDNYTDHPENGGGGARIACGIIE